MAGTIVEPIDRSIKNFLEYRLEDGIPVKYKLVVVHEFINHEYGRQFNPATIVNQYLETEEGQWVANHIKDKLMYNSSLSPDNFALRYQIVAIMSEKNATYYTLKYK